MDIYAQLADRIIEGQEEIIGPIAWEQALKVSGLKRDPATLMPLLQGDKKEILSKLVRQYEHLFGKTSIEVCKESIRPLLTEEIKPSLPRVLL